MAGSLQEVECEGVSGVYHKCEGEDPVTWQVGRGLSLLKLPLLSVPGTDQEGT